MAKRKRVLLAAKTENRLDSGRATPTVIQARKLYGAKLVNEPSTDFLSRKATQPNPKMPINLSPTKGQSKFWKQKQGDKEPLVHGEALKEE